MGLGLHAVTLRGQTTTFDTLDENKLGQWAATDILSYICSKEQFHCSEAPFSRAENCLIHVLIFSHRKPLCSSSSWLQTGRPCTQTNPFSHAHFSELVRGQQRPVLEGQLTKVTDGRVSAAFHLPRSFPASPFVPWLHFFPPSPLCPVCPSECFAADEAVFHGPVTGADRNVITPQRSHAPLRGLWWDKQTFRQQRWLRQRPLLVPFLRSNRRFRQTNRVWQRTQLKGPNRFWGKISFSFLVRVSLKNSKI